MDSGRYAMQNIPGDILFECGRQFAEHGRHNVESVSEAAHAIIIFHFFNLLYFLCFIPVTQLHFDCLSSFVRTHLSATHHFPAIVPGVVFGIDDNDAAAVRRLGHTWTRQIHILVHDTQKRWQIDKEIFIFGWFSVAVCSHHYIVYMHLLYRAKTTTEIE